MWTTLLSNWGPILLLIGFWVWIMRRSMLGRQGKYIERCMTFMDRQEQLLERIAKALESRDQ